MEHEETLQQLKDTWYDTRDNILPYKLVANGECTRYAFLQVARDAFEAEEGTALLMDHSDEQTRYIAYKYVQK